MFIHNEIRKNLSLFSDICKNHGIKSLYAFGSSVTEQFNPQRSDIDLLVEMEDMDPLEKGEKLLSLWDKLEDFFQRKVDLLTRKSLKIHFFWRISIKQKFYCMTIKEKKYLSDMMRAISLIESFTANTRSYTEYTMDLKTQSAVERQLAIIGEALNQYDKQPERISLNNTRQIVGFRNRIIHAYDSLDDTLVWAIVVNHLPALKSEVKTLLENC